MVTSGIRLGTPAGTTRGFGVGEFRHVGDLIAEVLDAVAAPTVSPCPKPRPVFAIRQGAVRAVPDLLGGFHALSLLHECRHASEGQSADGRQHRYSTPSGLSRLWRAFTTFERIQLRELTIIKNTGRKVPFDRDKLMRSVQVALRKRPVEPERIERMVSGIVRRLENLGESEVPAKLVGELVMEGLYALDQVGYVRFASVYRNFREAKILKSFWGNVDPVGRQA